MSVSETETHSEFQKKIADQLSGAFEAVVRQKEEFYSQNPYKVPSKSDVKSLISSCSNTNAIISGSLSLIPGPFGLIAAVPEIIMIVRNQISMVYDIGLAYGQKKVLNAEVLMYVVASAMGNATGALAIMHGSKTLIKRASLRVMQQLVKTLAGNVTQKLLKSMVVKFLPVLGAVAISVWTKYSTTSIGKKAADIFAHEIEYDNNIEVAELNEISSDEKKSMTTDFNLDKEKILCLISLMKIDGKIKEEEIQFIKPLIDKVDLPLDQKQDLMNLALNNEKVTFNIDTFKSNTNESAFLVIDMIALAKRDNEFHPAEKLYIKQIAKQFGFTDGVIEELMLTN